MKRPKPQIKLNSLRKFVTRSPKIKEAVSEITSGGIVYRRGAQGKLEILLIKDAKNRWTIPKGHIEPGEESGAAAEREIREETGLQDMEVLSWLGKVNFRYRREQTLVLMIMHIWLVRAEGATDKLEPEDWLNGIKWLPVQEAIDKIEYEDIGKLMLIGLKKVREEGL